MAMAMAYHGLGVGTMYIGDAVARLFVGTFVFLHEIVSELRFQFTCNAMRSGAAVSISQFNCHRLNESDRRAKDICCFTRHVTRILPATNLRSRLV